MRLTRCALAAATAAASASAVALLFFPPHWSSWGSDVTQVRTVSAMGASRDRTEPPEPSVTDPVPQASAPPCRSYGGPYCGWVRAYRGGCDWVWGLSYGIKDPDVPCPHDPRPSPSAAASSSAAPSPSESTASSGSGGTTGGGSGGTTAGLGRLAGPKHKSPAEPHRSASPSPTPAPGATATPAPAGHRPRPQSFPTGPGGMRTAPSSTGGVHAPSGVEPQVVPGEDGPGTAGLPQAVRTAARATSSPTSPPSRGPDPRPAGTADAAAPPVP
ncbi:hypothetical protein FB563_3588 [Streptomyces puniciscabiei]|uniref:Uncharacterized protein n=1 Tax=Streptomyces puniciscabiei TaxID=164348 RepID=A0A542UHJ4_9ACTN|nr:hypothetical protein FB563_3588 [Streptomyces puniciscabiei]